MFLLLGMNSIASSLFLEDIKSSFVPTFFPFHTSSSAELRDECLVTLLSESFQHGFRLLACFKGSGIPMFRRAIRKTILSGPGALLLKAYEVLTASTSLEIFLFCLVPRESAGLCSLKAQLRLLLLLASSL
jgi:hypothetical protein